MRRILKAREDERVEFGETVYLLRPNVKKSRGGLRDIHLVRWIGFVRHGEADIDRLARQNQISKTDADRLNAANEFLLRIRNELHFHSGRQNDGFGRNEQVRIAEKFGYTSRDEMLAVEGLMRDYFRTTNDVRFCSDNFVQNSQPRPSIATMLAPIVSRNVDEYFRMGPYQIGVRPGSIEEVRGNLESVLRLLQLANLHNKEIEPATWEAIRQKMMNRRRMALEEDSAARFMALISNPDGLGKSLRRLHEMQVLEKIIPGFRHARGLLQFNEYHKYTVDEHSILAVQRATEFKENSQLVGKVYRGIRKKNILHLALLIHDLGKGFPEDHSEVGLRLAKRIVKRLFLESEDADAVKFLVHNHLMMSHLALHRDINDDVIVGEFAANVGSLTILDMLFVLTCADIAAVGPNALTEWKLGLLTDLYRNARRVFTGDEHRKGRQITRERLEEEFKRLYSDEITRLWLTEKAQELPQSFLQIKPMETVGEQLLTLRTLPKSEIACWTDYDAKRKVSGLCIGTHERLRSGIFYKVNGLLAGLGLRINSADIKHLGDSIVWYWFQYIDRDYEGEPPAVRMEAIRKRVLEVANAPADEPPTFRKTWKRDGGRAALLSRSPVRVLIDNQTVDQATIIDVFAFQKTGLLYTIAKEIFEIGLDVRSARFSNYGQQTICVFYVTDKQRRKIFDNEQLDEIRKRILKSTRHFLR
jgi:[protein-PII] uridylyltransferase